MLLGLAFVAAGGVKLAQPKEKLAQNNMAWVEDFSRGGVRLIGALEVLGALGLVLPTLTGVLPWLTPLAALGLALLMAGAVYTHLRRGEGFVAVVPPSSSCCRPPWPSEGSLFSPSEGRSRESSGTGRKPRRPVPIAAAPPPEPPVEPRRRFFYQLNATPVPGDL